MIRARRWLIAAAAVALIALGGCSGLRGDVDLTFRNDGAFTERVSLEGVSLTSEQKAALEAEGWSIESGDDGLTASLESSSAASYATPNDALAGVIMQASGIRDDYASVPDLGSDVVYTITDYLFFERHEASLSLPALDFAPDQCWSCTGSGTEPCFDCDGNGWNTCEECDGAGTYTCDSCDGSGTTEGWFGIEECWSCDGTGREECWDCDGVGRLECQECDGSGEQYCASCGGSGEPTEEDIALYETALEDSALAVTVNMPGMVTSSEPGAWKFGNDDLEDLGTVTARSFVIAWLPTGIGLGVVVVIVGIVVWLITRTIRRAVSRSAERRAVRASAASAVQPVSTAARPMVAPATAPPTGAARFCRECGAPLGAQAQFCPKCGTRTTVAADDREGNVGS